MKINLLSDYRGVLTGEVFYSAGQHDLDDKTAAALIAAGRAVLVDEPPAPKPASPSARRGRKKA